MKYSIHINQSGISDAGLADGRTDLVDWAIVDYIHSSQKNSPADALNRKTPINYRILIKDMPLLCLNSKAAVSKRIHKLIDLGLISVERDADNRVFACLAPICDTILHEYPK